ncbi:hypothetical protein CR513_25139, partial [Mucuna pruriens]
MDIECAFLNGIINREVYVKQLPGFESDAFQNQKGIYGLKQPPCAWYEKLSSFLMKNDFERGKIKQADDDIYIHQTKYVKELLKNFKFDDCKIMSTSMHLTSILTLDDYDKKMLQGYCGANYARDRIERKNTNGGFHFIRKPSLLGKQETRYHCLVHYKSRVHIFVTSCCFQLLYIKHQLEDYNIDKSKIPLLCDNTVVINLSKNIVLHSRAKHMQIKHHFIRDYI